MRILLVGGSELMAWVVRRVAPSHVEVQHGKTFEEARSALRDRPPQAALFAVTPSRQPWDQLAQVCRERRPPIPFIDYFHAGGESPRPGAAGSRSDPHVPVPVDDLRERLEELIGEAMPGEVEAADTPHN